MQASKIFDILDMAQRARNLKRNFIPLFTGAPGVGKSSVCQQWVKEQQKTNPNFGFIDLRAAYLEAPDIIGFPSIEKLPNGRQVTKHNTPDFLPFEGQGLLLLEEPNRGTTSVMNVFMQLLTDRKIHKYELPKGWIIAACINPENEQHDVNTMDAALKNRFEIFDIDYDKDTFISYMKDREFDKNILMFIDSGIWSYSKPENIGDMPGSKYISPRTWEKLDNSLKAGITKDMELTVFESVLGKTVGRTFYSFIYNEKPVLTKDLLKEKKSALKRLKEFSDPNNYKNSLISITIKDIIENHSEFENNLIKDIILTIPADQGVYLIRELEYIKKDDTLLNTLCNDYPEVKKYFKDVLNRK